MKNKFKIEQLPEQMTNKSQEEALKYAISLAAKNGHKYIVELLLQDSRVDPSARDNEAIRLAAEYGHKDVLEILLKDPRVDPSAIYNDAIRWATQKDHKNVVELLLQTR